MTPQQITEYSILVDFLSKALGPSYEIALHDLEKSEIVCIANGHVSGRDVGSPLTNVALSMLTKEQYKDQDYRLNYSGISVKGKVIRSSTMFIKDSDGTPVGLLCINFDDSQFHELSTRILQLVHPDGFVREYFSNEDFPKSTEETEIFPSSLEEAMENVLREVTDNLSIPVERLTQDEKMQIVAQLDERGLFKLKGAVQLAAERLCCSQASMYRYISKVAKTEK